MRRRRLTWNKKATSGLPDEGYDHPAFIGQQPAEKYLLDNDGDGEAGTPSDFAEDVHQGPYENGAEPALPHEEWDHPAAMKQAARDIRASVERKAAKCIRIAQATLGKKATVADIENQALAFMDMADDQLDATLSRLSMEEPMGTAYMGEFDAEDSELEEMMAEFMAEDHEGEDAEAEAMLAEMLAGEEEVAMQEPMADQNDPEHFMAEEEIAMEEPMAEHHMSENDHGVAMISEEMDAMGLMGEEEMNAEDEDLLASIFGGKFASDEEEKEEEAEEKEEEKEEKESSKKASYKLKPRARKASQGVQSVGNVSKTAKSEMDDLSKLWQSAPDITDMF